MLEELLKKSGQRRAQDAKRFMDLNLDQCILCHAEGPDKRSLVIDCGYELSEISDLFIDLFETELEVPGWFLWICKTCRAALLVQLQRWVQERVGFREMEKSSDGAPLEVSPERIVPFRLYGVTVMLSPGEMEMIHKMRGG